MLALAAFAGTLSAFVTVALRRRTLTSEASWLEIALDRFPLLATTIMIVLTGYYTTLAVRGSDVSSAWKGIFKGAAPPTCTPPAGAALLGAYGGDIQGIYSIDIESNWLAKQLFTQGLLHLHGYNYIEARRNFEAAVEADASCSMCKFGLAFTYSPHINGEMTATDGVLAHGILRSALQEAGGGGGRGKVSDMMETLQLRFPSCLEEWERMGGQGYYDELLARELPLLAVRYPDDADIKALAAESIINTSPWKYYNATHNLLPRMSEAKKLLQEALRLRPLHPLALHLMIHLTEQSLLPQEGLAAANALRDLFSGRANGHLVHMPSHTYYVVGDYGECLSSSMQAVRLNDLFSRSCLVPYFPLHNKALLVQCAASAARLEPALEHSSETSLEEVKFTMALSPYPRILVQVRFGLWQEARRSLGQHGDSAGKDAYGRSIDSYANALVAVGLGDDPRAVQQKLSALGRAVAAIAPRDSSQLGLAGVFYPYLHEIGRLFNLTAHASFLVRQGQPGAAAELLREGVAIQDAFSYMEPEHHYTSMRQCYAAALLQGYEQTCGSPEGGCHGRRLRVEEEVVAAYQQDLALRPNNEWSLRGLLRALRAFNRTDVEVPQTYPSSPSVQLKGSCCELNLC